VATFEGEHILRVLVEPGLVAELHRQPKTLEPGRTSQDVIETLPAINEPRRELQEHYSEFACCLERQQRLAKPSPQLGGQLRGQISVVDVLSVEITERAADVGRQFRGRCLVLGKEPECEE
jgi:hypothetical protein